MKLTKYILLCLLIHLFFSCNEDIIKNDDYTPLNKYQEGEEYPIGKFSTRSTGSAAFGVSLPGMNKEQSKKFTRGDRFFIRDFSETSGLGPLFNSKNCSSCHFKDGRGKPLNGSTNNESESSRGFLMRLSIGNDPHSGPIASEIYGDQLQDRGTHKTTVIKGEAKNRVTYELINGTYPDGEKYQLRNPKYDFFDVKLNSLANLQTSPRVGQQTIGLGFIDGLSEDELLKNADENDDDGDGISGRANYVHNVRANRNTIGKFGWKANAPTLEQQVAGAFSGDMGLTTSLFPDEMKPLGQQDVVDYLNSKIDLQGIEIPDNKLEEIVFYQSTLSVPVRRNFKEKNVLEGKKLFHELKCIGCHKIGLTVDDSKILPFINGTVINPYSDFLLHDMGEDLADNRGDFLANGKEWRTQALWGIGLIKAVNKHTNLLHDGRARNVEEAILWHGGEADNSKQKFKKLSKIKREQVISFVNSL